MSAKGRKSNEVQGILNAMKETDKLILELIDRGEIATVTVLVRMNMEKTIEVNKLMLSMRRQEEAKNKTISLLRSKVCDD